MNWLSHWHPKLPDWIPFVGPQAQPEAQDSEWSVVSPGGITEILSSLDRDHRPMNALTLDGQFLGQARITAVLSHEIWFTLEPSEALPPNRDTLALNVCALRQQGAAMFSVQACQTCVANTWRAALPQEIIRMQSRQHRRIACVAGPLHAASIKLPEAWAHATLRDLSEEGIGLRWHQPPSPGLSQIDNAVLILDGAAIALPTLQIVHHKQCGPADWHIGAHMAGVAPATQRLVRRWLDVAETSQAQTARHHAGTDSALSSL